MPSSPLSSLSGEFSSPDRESAFQAERLPETVRHISLIFLASAFLNTLFFVSDWRFHGEPHFPVAILARAVVVLTALLCFWAVRSVGCFQHAQRCMIAWEWINGAAVAALVSSHSDLALFVVLMLPSIYYLAVPTSFRWSIVSGTGCSLMMLAGYLLPDWYGDTTAGLALAVLMLNFVLILVLARSNRLQRLQWSAIQAERCAKEELATSRAMFETMFKTVPIPLLVVRTDGAIAGHNDAAVRYFGATAEALGIQTIGELYVNPSDRHAFVSMLVRDGQVSNFETQVRLADGSIRTVLLVGRAVDIGGVQHIMSGVVDISERKNAEERVWRAASHDPLTRLPNRAFFQSRLEQVIAQADQNGTGVALLLLHLGNLRSVNETLGQDVGDALLRETANRLSFFTGDRDMVARLGQDELVIITVNPPDLSNVQALADRVLADLGQPFLHEGGALSIQASIGIASYPLHDRQPSELLKDADLALKTARIMGDNRAVLYSPEMRRELEQGSTATRDIQEALRQGQFVPFYQPKIDIVTGQVIGFEALARWHHPERGLLAPRFFLPAFEDAELSILFGEYMIRRVAADIRAWLDQGVDCGRIAINLSTAQFSWLGLAKRILDMLEAAGVPNDRLEIEITETVFLGRSAPHVVAALRQFQESGVRVALDDFGTGYASLIHLKQFPIDSIKIDQSFMKDVENDADSAAIVLAIIKLGLNLGMDVVAEGIETTEQAAFLRGNGCTLAQGYLYAKPMAATQVTQYLRQAQAQCA